MSSKPSVYSPRAYCSVHQTHGALPIADALGGDFYWAAGLSLISDIPKRPHWPVKLHGFVNAGRLDTIDRGEVHHALSELLG